MLAEIGYSDSGAFKYIPQGEGDCGMTTGHQEEITDRIQAIREKEGLNIKEFAHKCDIGYDMMTKLLRNERSWQIDHLSKIAQAFKIPLTKLVIRSNCIPVVAETAAGFPFKYQEAITKRMEAAEWVEIPGEVPNGDIPMIYAVRVRGSSMSPSLEDGTIAYAKLHSGHEIRNKDMVIFVDEKGLANIRKVQFEGDHIILKALNPAIPDIIRPRQYLGSLDRVIYAKF